MNAEQIRKLADGLIDDADGTMNQQLAHDPATLDNAAAVLRACAEVVEAAEAYHAEGTGVASDVLKALAKLEALKC